MSEEVIRELHPITCVHIKSGNIYTVLDNCVIDATDNQNDRILVLYKNKQGDLFVREKKEFYQRFKALTDNKNRQYIIYTISLITVGILLLYLYVN